MSVCVKVLAEFTSNWQ